MSLLTCPVCPDKIYATVGSLAKHWVVAHGPGTVRLYLALSSMKSEPTCRCGCGAATKFLSVGRGFSEYVHGHQARVNNNYQSEKSRRNSSATRQKMISSGELKPFRLKSTGEHWAKGLTKETDDRVRRMAETVSEPEESQRRAERMRQNRLTGVVRTLRKEEHSQWKGGISPLNHYCHANRRLYTEWKYPKMVAAGFKCSHCAGIEKLEVHHDKERFSDILRLVAANFNWEGQLATTSDGLSSPESLRLKDSISNGVADYHIANQVSGVVLCARCHRKQHKVSKPISVAEQPKTSIIPL